MSQINWSELSPESIKEQQKDLKVLKQAWLFLLEQEKKAIDNDIMMKMRIDTMKQMILCNYKLRLIYPELKKILF